MSRVAIAGTLVLALLAAGCGGGKASSSSASSTGHSTNPVASGPPTTPGLPPSRAARVTPGTPVVSPTAADACSTTVSEQPRLKGVSNSFLSMPGTPFGVVTTSNGRFAIVSSPSGSVIDVVLLRSATPSIVHAIRLAHGATPLGLALTPNGHYLLVASNAGVVVLSVARVERGERDAELGSLSEPNRTGGGVAGGGAIEVTTAADGRYAFVSLEDQGSVAVFDLGAAIADRFRGSHLVGLIRLGVAPVGLAVSPDGRWLYATSEFGGPGLSLHNGIGSVSTIDVLRAVHGPAGSVIASLPAGCNPVRVATSPDGSIVWVTARASDELLAFSAAKLRQGSRDALLAAVRVGEAPVGLEPVDAGRHIVVADSNRFGAGGVRAGLTVVNTASMLAGRPSIEGALAAGGFPRQMAITPDGQTLLVTDFTSGQLQAVRLAGLP